MGRHQAKSGIASVSAGAVAASIVVVVAFAFLIRWLFIDDTVTTADQASQAAQSSPFSQQESSAAHQESIQTAVPSSPSDAGSAVATPPQTANDAAEKQSATTPFVAASTLFLLDTSADTAPYFDSLSAGIATAAEGSVANGSATGLWNYSSPLNAGVTRGWRDNLEFGSTAEDIAWQASLYGTGGVPQTRSSVLAALEYASNQAVQTNRDVRVVVITSGTDEEYADEEFRRLFTETKDDDVLVSVVQFGDGAKDKILGELADAVYAAPSTEDIPQAITRAVGLAE